MCNITVTYDHHYWILHIVSSLTVIIVVFPTQDVCEMYPCNSTLGEICLRGGGVTCLSRLGCRDNTLRTCVVPAALRCRISDDGAGMTLCLLCSSI